MVCVLGLDPLRCSTPTHISGCVHGWPFPGLNSFISINPNGLLCMQYVMVAERSSCERAMRGLVPFHAAYQLDAE